MHFDRTLSISDSDTSWTDSFQRQLFEERENMIEHDYYHYEYRLCSCIFHGDIDSLREILTEIPPDYQGRLSDIPIRNEINRGIVAITLISRSAILAGVFYEEALLLSNHYINQLETIHTYDEAFQLCAQAAIQFCQMVSSQNHNRQNLKLHSIPDTSPNLHIEQCKNYIFSHIQGKITVQEIADAIGLEANYLSTLFHKQMNITIKQYIMEQKINVAKKMLMYSPFSYIEISTYLGFSSQSHFGAEFKKYTELTPKQFRIRYQKKDEAGEDQQDISSYLPSQIS